jgi:tRNA pseudouridine13 synthase
MRTSNHSMRTPDFEQSIGINSYLTALPGVEGKVRVNVDDFHVTELPLFPPKKENGIFTIAEVSARNWETHLLVQELAHRLHFSQRRISFAGTKDKRAWSTQLMSFERVSPELLSQVNIKDVTLQNMYQSDTPVRIGSLRGNHFEITIRNLDPSITPEHIATLISPLEQLGGFPNYYGIQRFGAIRSITHLVGKYIVQGDFENAVMSYVAHPMQGEHESTYALRADLEKTRNYTKAFHAYPESLHFEKALLNKLIQTPSDFRGALLELPKNLLLMFINAYESLLFNKILSERMRRSLPINQAIIGDLIAPIRKDIVTDEYLPVTESNLEKVNAQLVKKKAVVTGLLLGYDAVFARGEMGEIEHRIVEDEHIDPRDFIIPEIPFLSSGGTRRALVASLSSLQWTLHLDQYFENRQALTLQFDLPKGCYATCFLREIMKSSDVKNY